MKPIIRNARRRAWAPLSCTLPAARLPLRVAEFDALFAEAVQGIERVGPERLRLELLPSPRAAGRAAELAAAETQCCSFFTFTLTATGRRPSPGGQRARPVHRRARRAGRPGRGRPRLVTGLRSGEVARAAGRSD
jgi:hypothetical protein